MFGWLKDEPPDAWTPDRVRRVRRIDHFDGDVDKARAAETLRERMQFAAFLVDTGRIGRGDDHAD